VYVGTDCGLAASADLGANWTFAPLPAPNSRVHAAVAANGLVDICADDGHHRFIFAAGILTPVGGADPIHGPVSGAPGAGCAVEFTMFGSVHDIASAPQEPNAVLFALAPSQTNPGGCNSLYESDNGGLNWAPVLDDCFGKTFSEPWVTTRLSTDGNPNHFDVYYSGTIATHKITCAAFTFPNSRCGTPVSGPTFIPTAHADHQGIAFRPGSSCPQYLVTDGGVQTTGDCGASFHMTAGSGSLNGGFNALQIYDLTGQISPTHTDLYFGTQDNSIWASPDKGATWPTAICCEFGAPQVPRIAGDASEFVTLDACGNCQLVLAPAQLAGCSFFVPAGACQLWNRPPGNPPSGPRAFEEEDAPYVIDRGAYLEWTEPISSPPTEQLNITTDFGQSWNLIHGATITGLLADRPFIAGPAATPTVYQPFCVGSCFTLSSSTVHIARLRLTRGAGGVTATVGATGDGTCATCLGEVGIYSDGHGDFRPSQVAFGVEPGNPNHLIAADVGPGQMKMKVSRDGGQHWSVDSQLTNLVTGAGRYSFMTPHWGTEARAIAFDPTNGNHIVVGTENAGIIASVDGGKTWQRMVGSERVPTITGLFFDEVPNEVLVSTFGRGIWKLELARPTKLVAAPASKLARRFSATLTLAADGTPVVAETVAFTIPGIKAPVCSATTDSNGTAVCTGSIPLDLASQLAFLLASRYTAIFAGNANYGRSTATGSLGP
jgi:hypothetical protein